MKNNQYISASAPGKLLLLGEHAVVYGYPSLVTAVDTRLTVSIEEAGGAGVRLDTPGVSDTRFILKAIDVAKKYWKKPLPDMVIHTKSNFSPLYGLGSSSAVTVATLYVLSKLLGKNNIPKKEIFTMAYEAVLAVQGKGSGFDVAAAVFGGTLYYGDGGNICEPVDVKDMPLIIGYTGVKADTTSLIDAVARKKNQYPQKVDRIFQAIGTLVTQAKKALEENDWKMLGKYMNFNQEYLRDLGISSEKLEALIHAAAKGGSYGAKLSGAGGGDCMIALCANQDVDKKRVEQSITEAGGEIVHLSSGAEGVRLEPSTQVTTDDQGELFVVVNERDEIIGHRTRYECHHDPSLLHRTVGAVIFNDTGDVLLQKRSSTKDMDPGLWGISVAGHVTKDQTDDDAIQREMNEELGIRAPLTFVTKFIYHDPKESERAAIYKGVHNGPFVPHIEEVAEVQFFNPRELRFKVADGSIHLTSGAMLTLQKVGVLP